MYGFGLYKYILYNQWIGPRCVFKGIVSWDFSSLDLVPKLYLFLFLKSNHSNYRLNSPGHSHFRLILYCSFLGWFRLLSSGMEDIGPGRNSLPINKFYTASSLMVNNIISYIIWTIQRCGCQLSRGGWASRVSDFPRRLDEQCCKIGSFLGRGGQSGSPGRGGDTESQICLSSLHVHLLAPMLI